MDRFDRKRQTLAMGLAALAGFVDAVGFLSANGYFVSFMSGNTTRLGVDLARGFGPALVPAGLIAGFVIGVAAGAVIAGSAGARRKPAVLALVSALLLGAAFLETLNLRMAPLALLVMAMGALNNTFLRGGEVAIGLTYMTGALVKLGQAIGARLLGDRRSGWGGYLLLWAALAVGATGGALTFAHLGVAALWVAGCWALAMTALATRIPA